MSQQQQSQYPMPQQPYSPPQTSTSPGPSQPFSLPPNKRQRMSPSPNPPSPYMNAPGPTDFSPHLPNVQLPPGAFSSSYTNGVQPMQNSTPYQSPFNLPNQPPPNPTNHQPNYNNLMAPQGVGMGMMGPPSKPPEKPKEDGVDVMDVLGGTGIDLREEEQYTFQMYSSFNSQVSGSQAGNILSAHSFTQFPPGDERSFYGAGPANQPAERANAKSQDEFHRKAAEKAWQVAARDVAISRQRELNDPFLLVAIVHKRMDKIARENGLTVNTDANGKMGTMKLPEDFPNPNVKVKTAKGPNGAITSTYGVFIPADSLLVDQLALLSIATKYRLRGLLEDATKLAKGRQVGSHGIIPSEWVDVAEPSNAALGSLVTDGAPRSGWESAVSPRTNPIKRILPTTNRIPTPISDGTKTPLGTTKFSNEVVNALRGSAAKERELEEARLRKRISRTTGDTPRSGSIIPGTPGSVAPDSIEKAPTRKEQKKKAEAKVNEAASHAAANVTTAQFLGGGSGLFGKKKKYSWMTGGGANATNGTSTPGRIMTQGLPGTPNGPLPNAAPDKLTADSVRRLGTWREDHEKGLGIQIRDWITVLEDDGREKRALQQSYANLDASEPK
ncbi:hypothetical protein B7494_g4261 [Chlorociboria aeruginascens]|nr:hypothetical protein B7494_g4261 [Chlorociboria aeruginascens]